MKSDKELIVLEHAVGDVAYWLLTAGAIIWPLYVLWN